MSRTIKAPTGNELTCKNWLSEAAYRMIQSNLDKIPIFNGLWRTLKSRARQAEFEGLLTGI